MTSLPNNLRKDELRKLVYDKNTKTLLEDGLAKVIEGITSVEEVLRVISIEDDFGSDDKELRDAFIGNNIEASPTTQNATYFTNDIDSL